MTDEEKNAIENLKLFLDKDENNLMTNEKLEIILNLIQKQEKVIDEMVEYLSGNNFEFVRASKEQIKQYFIER